MRAIRGIEYQVLTRLIFQSFVNHLEMNLKSVPNLPKFGINTTNSLRVMPFFQWWDGSLILSPVQCSLIFCMWLHPLNFIQPTFLLNYNKTDQECSYLNILHSPSLASLPLHTKPFHYLIIYMCHNPNRD